MNLAECFQHCYDHTLNLSECRKLLDSNGHGYWSGDCIADELEEIYCVEEGK